MKLFIVKSNKQKLLEELLRLFRSKQHCDVKISNDDDYELEAHKLILAACSKSFEDLFKKSSDTDRVVHLPQCEKETLKALISCLYEEKIIISEEVSKKVLKLAKKLQIDCEVEGEAPEETQILNDISDIDYETNCEYLSENGTPDITVAEPTINSEDEAQNQGSEAFECDFLTFNFDELDLPGMNKTDLLDTTQNQNKGIQTPPIDEENSRSESNSCHQSDPKEFSDIQKQRLENAQEETVSAPVQSDSSTLKRSTVDNKSPEISRKKPRNVVLDSRKTVNKWLTVVIETESNTNDDQKQAIANNHSSNDSVTAISLESSGDDERRAAAVEERFMKSSKSDRFNKYCLVCEKFLRSSYELQNHKQRHILEDIRKYKGFFKSLRKGLRANK